MTDLRVQREEFEAHGAAESEGDLTQVLPPVRTWRLAAVFYTYYTHYHIPLLIQTPPPSNVFISNKTFAIFTFFSEIKAILRPFGDYFPHLQIPRLLVKENEDMTRKSFNE